MNGVLLFPGKKKSTKYFKFSESKSIGAFSEIQFPKYSEVTIFFFFFQCFERDYYYSTKYKELPKCYTSIASGSLSFEIQSSEVAYAYA